MKDKYILIEWPESQEFLGHPDCYIAENSACFVPEDLIIELESNNKEILEISKMSEQYSDLEKLLRESIRHFLSRKLMDTSEENPLECNIATVGLEVGEFWQESDGLIYIRSSGYGESTMVINIDDLDIENLTELCKGISEI